MLQYSFRGIIDCHILNTTPIQLGYIIIYLP